MQLKPPAQQPAKQENLVKRSLLSLFLDARPWARFGLLLPARLHINVLCLVLPCSDPSGCLFQLYEWILAHVNVLIPAARVKLAQAIWLDGSACLD